MTNQNKPQGMLYSMYFPYWEGGIRMQKNEEVMASLKKVVDIPEAQKYHDPADSAEVDHMEVGKDGGIRVYLKGHPLPVRVYGDKNGVRITAIYKRFIPLFFQSLSTQNVFKKLITLLSLKWNMPMICDWLEHVIGIGNVLLDENHYSQPVKELRRVLRGRIPEQMMNALTLVMEFDSAYRYPPQDILPLLDKSKLNKVIPMIKELQRLLQLLGDRSINGDGRQGMKFKRMKPIVWILLVMPKTRKLIRDIFQDMNMDEIKMNEEDICFTNRWGTYSFRGLSWDERKAENKLKYGI